jgi:uncharacterized circularly permuted ATP-grasp superfamily protein
MSKIFPEFNKNFYRSRLSPYFSEIQQTIANLNNGSGETPNVVVLTPGLGNETYFEHTLFIFSLRLYISSGQRPFG